MDDPKDKGSMSSDDPYGIGMNADGTLNVVLPDQLAARIAERNKWDKMTVDEIQAEYGDAPQAE